MAIIAKDVGLSGRILKVVNSPFSGLRKARFLFIGLCNQGRRWVSDQYFRLNGDGLCYCEHRSLSCKEVFTQSRGVAVS